MTLLLLLSLACLTTQQQQMVSSACVNDVNQSYPNVTIADIEDLRSDVVELLLKDDGILPEVNQMIGHVVRFIFHDCGGPNFNAVNGSICDGCIDFNNEFHRGLESLAVEPLEELYNDEDIWCSIMSRADFYASCATIALEFAHFSDKDHNDNFSLGVYYFGRKICNNSSPEVDTTAIQAGMKDFPDPLQGIQHVISWLYDNLGFSVRETVAILGAHTLGSTHKSASQLQRSNNISPWVVNNNWLNNRYYVDMINENFDWEQGVSNNDLGWLWSAKNHDSNEDNFYIMLNPDISLIKVINTDGNSFGIANCTYDNCERQTITADIVDEYANDNALWLEEFADVFKKLVTTGYDIPAGELYSVDAGLFTHQTSTTTTTTPKDCPKSIYEFVDNDCGERLIAGIPVDDFITLLIILIVVVIIIICCCCCACKKRRKRKKEMKQITKEWGGNSTGGVAV